MPDNLPGLLNVALCTIIVLTLFFYRRKDATHKPLVSWLAWLLMLVYAFVPLNFLFGQMVTASWVIVLINLVSCMLVLLTRGNVSKILSILRG
ncbi:phage holin family protein [Escherichia coli]|uniref:phage holin family protein n=2 Tax=Escherichia coli TaxID=562 RepID=UPI000BA5A233|nr:phage holin family protein [Escherichia coli]PAL27950.1 holin [Escherichia coli]PAL39900.1 holin [Escherichia coli]PAL44764.1 holin [Escherichia coli]